MVRTLASIYIDDSSDLEYGCPVQLDDCLYRVLRIWDGHRVLLATVDEWEFEVTRLARLEKNIVEVFPGVSNLDKEIFTERMVYMDRNHQTINWAGPLIRLLYTRTMGVIKGNGLAY